MQVPEVFRNLYNIEYLNTVQFMISVLYMYTVQYTVINRPGVAEAVLQTASSLIE